MAESHPIDMEPKLSFSIEECSRHEALSDALRLLQMVVFDFDGVFTDNAVWVREDGVELVRCSRADGLGIARLLSSGMPTLVLSTETNLVVSARCRKLNLPVLHGIADKGARLKEFLDERRIDPKYVAFVGNDINDEGCLKLVGLPVVVADAHPSISPLAKMKLVCPGGHGAVREFCDAVVDSRSDISGLR